MPHFFRIPCAASVGAVEELPADAPTAVAAFDEVNDARAVAAIGIVIACEKIAVLIEGEFLGIAQAVSEYFEFGAVRITAEDAASVWIADGFAIDFDVRTAIA